MTRGTGSRRPNEIRRKATCAASTVRAVVTMAELYKRRGAAMCCHSNSWGEGRLPHAHDAVFVCKTLEPNHGARTLRTAPETSLPI